MGTGAGKRQGRAEGGGEGGIRHTHTSAREEVVVDWEGAGGGVGS